MVTQNPVRLESIVWVLVLCAQMFTNVLLIRSVAVSASVELLP